MEAASLAGVLGETGEINVQGEAVQRLDAAGSDIFVDLLGGCGRVAAIGSEEIEDPSSRAMTARRRTSCRWTPWTDRRTSTWRSR